MYHIGRREIDDSRSGDSYEFARGLRLRKGIESKGLATYRDLSGVEAIGGVGLKSFQDDIDLDIVVAG